MSGVSGLRLTQLLFFLLLGVDNTQQQLDQVYLYRTAGDTVTLPFQNRIPDDDPGCVSTEWIHSGNYFASVTVAENGLIQAGELSPSKAERLCLESNCSLTVKDVSAEDAGFYTVRQYEDGERRGYDQRIYLSVLEVSDVTRGDGGSEAQTLQCSLSAMDRSCGVHTLSWIKEDGSLIKSMSGCSTTLTVDKRRPANKIRCLLIVHGELRTFVVFPEEKREKKATSKVCTGTSPVDYTTDPPPAPDSDLTVLLIRPTVILLILLLQFIVQYHFWKWKATRGQKAEVKNTEMDYVNVPASRS